MDELELVRFNNKIDNICSSIHPLSSDVAIIHSRNALWLYDVGNHPGISELLKSIAAGYTAAVSDNYDKRLNIVLSHFHIDHIGNLNGIKEAMKAYNITLYQGRYTYKHTCEGIVVEDDVYIKEDGLQLHIFPLPSSHAKGCIALEVDGEYCFTGDGLYAMQKGTQRLYNAGVLKEEIAVLKNVKADSFMCSHRPPQARSRNSVIRWLESIYEKRNKNSAYIEVGS